MSSQVVGEEIKLKTLIALHGGPASNIGLIRQFRFLQTDPDSPVSRILLYLQSHVIQDTDMRYVLQNIFFYHFIISHDSLEIVLNVSRLSAVHHNMHF